MTPAVENIVRKFRMRLCEVVSLPSDHYGVLRFDFWATADCGTPFVGGAVSISFSKDDDPLQVSEKLRGMADLLDAHWEKAFGKSGGEG